MRKIFKYAFLDLIRSRWSIAFFAFFLLVTSAMLYLGGDFTRTVVSLMNIVIFLIPLTCLIFTVMYFYQVREFTELLLSQPISRKQLFSGYYWGISLALSLCFAAGIGLPFLVYGMGEGSALGPFLFLLFTGIMLCMIFSGLGLWIVLSHENKLKGFGIALLIWLLLSIVYDGLFLIALIAFGAYPLEKFALVSSFLNPIDLSRTLMLFQLDNSAMMGYTGAVFKKFFGTFMGTFSIAGGYLLWIMVPYFLLLRKALRKDF